jgi:hypothetical protein
MRMFKMAWFFVSLLMLIPAPVRSADFETFDGRNYNGKFYPRIDIIEWNDTPEEPTHMEFHVFWKGHALDTTFLLEKKDGKTVMNVNYFVKERNEHLCRRVVAPGHFTDKFMVYRDTSDKDFDNIIVTMLPVSNPKAQLVQGGATYASCEMPKLERMPANDSPAPTPKDGSDQVRPKGDAGAIKKAGHPAPFDW